MLVLKTAAGGSTGGNGAHGRCVTVMNRSTGKINEIAYISYFKMLTLASETSIYARTAGIKSLFGDTVCFAVRSLNVLKRSKISLIFQLICPNNRKNSGKAPF